MKSDYSSISIIYPGKMILGTSKPKVKNDKHIQLILFSVITICELPLELSLIGSTLVPQL